MQIVVKYNILFIGETLLHNHVMAYDLQLQKILFVILCIQKVPEGFNF
jgi:hypothetical protein